MFSARQLDLARQVLTACRQHQIMLATAESCTGGLIAACLTEIPGSSDVVDRGFVTYSNAAKREMVGVSAADLAEFGAVSEVVARRMATGALTGSGAGVAVACTGVAGPGGGTPQKPVGLVHLACAMIGKETAHLRRTYGNIGRDAIRQATIEDALALVLAQLEETRNDS